MASIAAPLITALEPVIVNLIASLTHKAAPVAEANLGPGTGIAKFADVFAAVIASLNSAAAAGTISKTLPPDPVIQMIIQAAIQTMQLDGLLGSTAVSGLPAAAAKAVSSTQTIKLTAGQTLTVSA